MRRATYDGKDRSKILWSQPLVVCQLMECGGNHVEYIDAIPV